MFGPFKEHLRNLVESVSSPEVTPVYTLFDYLKMVRHAYSKSFSSWNILSGFKKDWHTAFKLARSHTRSAASFIMKLAALSLSKTSQK